MLLLRGRDGGFILVHYCNPNIYMEEQQNQGITGIVLEWFGFFQLALKSSFIKDPSETDIAFRHFMLELVCDKYLQFSQQAYNPNHQYVGFMQCHV